jgi:Restriction endonuclease S subunits
MSEKIPDGWNFVTFGDVITQVKDKFQDRSKWYFERYIGGEHFEEGAIRVTNSNPIKGNEDVIGSAFHMRFKPGHVLYVSRNPRLRKGGMVDFEGICSNTTYVLQANESKLIQSLLPFIIQTEDFVKHATNSAHGSTNPFLNWKDIANYKFLLPPLEEQAKIAEVLWAIEKNVEKNETLIKSADFFKKKVLNDLLTKGIERTTFKKTDLGEVPETWNVENLERLTTKIVDGVHKKPEYIEKGVPFLTVKNLTSSSGIDFSDVNYISETDHLEYLKRANPEQGDILVTKDGTLGIVRMIETEIDFSIFVSLALLKPDKDKINNRYLCYALEAPFIQNQFGLNATGSALKHIHLKDFRKTLCPVPPLEEQKKIIEILDDVSNTCNVYKNHLTNLSILKKKLINDFLSGNLKIPQEALQNVQ